MTYWRPDSDVWDITVGRIMAASDLPTLTVDPSVPIFNRLFAERFPLRIVMDTDCRIGGCPTVASHGYCLPHSYERDER